MTLLEKVNAMMDTANELMDINVKNYDAQAIAEWSGYLEACHTIKCCIENPEELTR